MVHWLGISVGAHFNKVNIPLGLLLLFLTGVGALLAWAERLPVRVWAEFSWPIVIGLLGARSFPWARGIFMPGFFCEHVFVAARWREVLPRREGDSRAEQFDLAASALADTANTRGTAIHRALSA